MKNYESMTSAELRKIAKSQGIPNFGNMTKEQLLTCLNDPSKIDEMNAQVRAKLADQAARRAGKQGSDTKAVATSRAGITTDELWIKVNTDDNTFNTICYLYERWQDEHKYEDINDYLKVIQKKVPEACEMHKRPFGFTAKCIDGNLKVIVKNKGAYLELEGYDL